MIFSATLVLSVLSLLSFTGAATVPTRRDDCTFVCPDKDLDGDALFNSTIGDGFTACAYAGKSFKLCAFNSTSGVFIGDGGNGCPKQAVQQCLTDNGSKRDYVPPPSSDWSPPTWSPSPSPTWNKSKPTPPPTPQPCAFRCPQQDLDKNPLTDEAIRGPYLFCSYSTPHCDTCDFCKYSTKTGQLLEDNDGGNCPRNASATRPWDRRHV